MATSPGRLDRVRRQVRKYLSWTLAGLAVIFAAIPMIPTREGLVVFGLDVAFIVAARISARLGY